jgi:hypothetical protein
MLSTTKLISEINGVEKIANKKWLTEQITKKAPKKRL